MCVRRLRVARKRFKRFQTTVVRETRPGKPGSVGGDADDRGRDKSARKRVAEPVDYELATQIVYHHPAHRYAIYNSEILGERDAVEVREAPYGVLNA